MMCNAYLARTSTATLALVASGYLAMSGTAAEQRQQQRGCRGRLVCSNMARRLAGSRFASTTNLRCPTSMRSRHPEPDKKPEKTPGRKRPETRLRRRHAKPSRVAANNDLFRSIHSTTPNYNADGQVDIYGAKRAVPSRSAPAARDRPAAVLPPAPTARGSTFLGEKNPLLPGLPVIYGDWRTAIASNNNNGKNAFRRSRPRLRPRRSTLKITGTERVHAFFTPLQKNNKFSRFEFGNGDGSGRFPATNSISTRRRCSSRATLDHSIPASRGEEASFDLRRSRSAALSAIPAERHLGQRQHILGGAVPGLPAKNSAALKAPANFDITFSPRFDNVDNASIIGADKGDNHLANLYGVSGLHRRLPTSSIETELRRDPRPRRAGQPSIPFLTAAYTHRYFNTVSNSTRVFANFGSDPEEKPRQRRPLPYSENSLVTGLPSTLLPYANFFVGVGNPQPLVDGNNASILKNVGINFETDALSKAIRNSTTAASNAFGGAIGLRVPCSTSIHGSSCSKWRWCSRSRTTASAPRMRSTVSGSAIQVPIDRAWLFRADATLSNSRRGDEDNFGLRAESGGNSER